MIKATMLRNAVSVLRCSLVKSAPCSCKNPRKFLNCWWQNRTLYPIEENYLISEACYLTKRNFSTLKEDKQDNYNVRNYLSTLNEEEQIEHVESELSKLTDVEKKRLKVLEMEYDVWQSTGVRVPDKMTNVSWYILLNTPSITSRRKLYSFWFKKEKAILSDLKKKEKRQEVHQQRRAEKRKELEKLAAEQGLPPGKLPFKETIFMFLRTATMNTHFYNNLAWAMQFGQPILFDLSLEDHMKDKERSSLCKQIVDCHGINKVRREPFHFCMTGVVPDGFITRSLVKFDHSFTKSAPLTLSSEHYLDLFPREKLVYLSPNAREELKQWNHDDIFIIGGLVDLAVEKPITLAKAKREGIRSARLPLDKYLLWESGSKSLTLDVVMKILCDIKDTGDWVKALRHIPKRKAKLRPQYTEDYKLLQQKFRKNNRKK